MKFEDILQEHNIAIAPPSHEHSRAGWIQFDCPWCSPGWQHYRMGYNSSYHYVNCWACGRHNLMETVVELTGLSRSMVARLLRGLETSPKIARPERTKLVLPKGIMPLARPHDRYLEGRGFNPRKLERLWEIKGFRLNSRFSWCLWIPIHLNGQVVSWTTRKIVDEGVRYVSAGPNEEAIDHKTLLYGEDYCRHAIIVVEGPTDTWRGGPGFAATFGTSFTRGQVLRISKYPLRAVCYDSQPDAQRQARKLCDELAAFPGTTHNIVLDSKDPGEAALEELKVIRQTFLLQ